VPDWRPAREGSGAEMFDTVPQLDCAGRILRLDRPRVMGIVNVTPDSFSDGGEHATADAAIAHGLKLAGEGADILDIGGESTRPGAEAVARRKNCDVSCPSSSDWRRKPACRSASTPRIRK